MMSAYSRDKRSPTPSSENTSHVMSANKRKDTKPEIILRRALCDAGLSGYRLQWKVSGRPDIAYPGRKIAIFINGCFWHRCPYCNLPLPKSNTNFWVDKFKKNQERDERDVQALEDAGWIVITIWECEIKKDVGVIIDNISTHFLDRSKAL